MQFKFVSQLKLVLPFQEHAYFENTLLWYLQTTRNYFAFV